jgi:hypothetical protein
MHRLLSYLCRSGFGPNTRQLAWRRQRETGKAAKGFITPVLPFRSVVRCLDPGQLNRGNGYVAEHGKTAASMNCITMMRLPESGQRRNDRIPTRSSSLACSYIFRRSRVAAVSKNLQVLLAIGQRIPARHMHLPNSLRGRQFEFSRLLRSSILLSCFAGRHDNQISRYVEC